MDKNNVYNKNETIHTSEPKKFLFPFAFPIIPHCEHLLFPSLSPVGDYVWSFETVRSLSEVSFLTGSLLWVKPTLSGPGR